VLDNLFVGVDSLWTKSLPTREKYRTAEAIMRDLTGLDIDPDALVGPLLLSIKQWITIGRALLCRPKVLILDESSAALDFDSTEKLFEKMRALRDAGAAVLIVTHRIAELIRVSDRATVLRDGRDVGVLGRGEITEENLLRLMTGKGPSAEAGERSAAESAGGDTVLRARGLKVWPGGPDVDFALRRGEIVGVAGLDGQGQNEFVRVLAGVQPAVAGVPEVRGATGNFGPVRDLDDADRAGVAYVSGDRKREGIFPNLSVFENLLIALYPKALRGRVAGIIDWASLGTVFDSNVEKLSVKLGLKSDKVTSLSGGNQQKVLIGRAFALGPRILVLNDPARGIDVEAKRELYGHLRDFAARGNAVVFLSSELEEFIGLCQRVIVFRHGGVFDTFVGEDVDAVRILEAMFGHAVAHGRPTARPESARRAPSRPRQDDAPRVETAPIRATPRPPTEIRVVDFEAKRPANGGVDRADDGKHIKIVYSDS
jgi:ribose transport system ATP-binding protein